MSDTSDLKLLWVRRATLKRGKGYDRYTIYLPPMRGFVTEVGGARGQPPRGKGRRDGQGLGREQEGRHGPGVSDGWLATQGQRYRQGQVVQVADAAHPLLWVGGGACLIVEDGRGGRYVVGVKRDSLAPTNPGRLTLCSGGASSPAELRSPRLLLREGLEEVVFYDGSGRLLIPRLRMPGLEVAQVIRRAARRAGLPTRQWAACPAQWCRSLHDSLVRVVDGKGGVYSVTRGVAHWDGAAGTFNLISILKVGVNLHSVDCFDTECHRLADGFQPLKRDVVFIPLEGIEVERGGGAGGPTIRPFSGLTVNGWRGVRRWRRYSRLTPHLARCLLLLKGESTCAL